MTHSFLLIYSPINVAAPLADGETAAVVERKVVDASKLVTLGWEPRSVEESIRDTVGLSQPATGPSN